MTKTITASQAKAKFYEILRNVSDRDNEVVITKDGKPAAIIVSCREFEQLMETLEVLSDKKTLKRIQQGRTHIKQKGKFLSHEDVFGS